MRPNYGNKRVYLEGEEKYHFPGGENGEESGMREGNRREGANEGGVRDRERLGGELGSRWLVMVGLFLFVQKFETPALKSQ